MAEECPTGILLDLSEPAELSSEVEWFTKIDLNSDPVDVVQFLDCAKDKDQFDSPSKEERGNVSNEFDCEFIENETLNELSACSTQSSSNSEDEVLPIIWISPVASKKTLTRVIKDNLSIGQRVEVFKEATCIAMHLENLSRGTPPAKPLRNLFTSPLLEKNLHTNTVLNSNKVLESRFDLEMCSKEIENKRPETETTNHISFRPPKFAKPEARVQPILKSKINEKEYAMETLSIALRMNKNKTMATMTSSSRPSGPVKVKKGSPMKQPGKQQRVISKGSINSAIIKMPLPNSKPVSSICTPLNARSTTDKCFASVTRSSSFGAESLRIRRQSALLSASFSVYKPSIHSQMPDRQICSPQSSANSKSVGRRSIEADCSTPAQTFASEYCRSFVQSSTVKRSVIPTVRLTPRTASNLTPLKRSSSALGDIPKKNLRRYSTSGNSPKKAVMPTPKLLSAHLRSAVSK